MEALPTKFAPDTGVKLPLPGTRTAASALREGLAGLQQGLQVAEDPRPPAAAHRAELVVARRHGVEARHAGELVSDGEPADPVLTGPLDLPGEPAEALG